MPKLPETALFGDKVYIVENKIAKKRTVDLKYKGSGFILVEGDLTENDQVISTRIPSELHNKKVTVLN